VCAPPAGANASYTISLDTDNFLNNLNPVTVTKSWQSQPDTSGLTYLWYFLPLQLAVDRSIVALRTNTSVVPFTVSVQQVSCVRCEAIEA
jgi:hypothetical protein